MVSVRTLTGRLGKTLSRGLALVTALLVLWLVAPVGGQFQISTLHKLLSALHTDTTPATAVRGDLIVAQGVSPKWGRLGIGASGTVLASDGIDASWTALGGSSIGGFTPGSVIFASAGGTLTEDNTHLFFTDASDTLTATKLVAPTFVSTPSIITASGALGITPAAGSSLNVNLSTTGDFAVNTNDLYVDTSLGYVGIGTTAPTTPLQVTQTGMDGSGTASMLLLQTDAKTVGDGVVLNFAAKNASAVDKTYFSLFTTIVDATAGSEDGQVYFRILANASAVIHLAMRGGYVGIGTGAGPFPPGTGSGGALIFGQQTAIASLASNTAGVQAVDVGGTAHMFAVSEAGVSMQLTGTANNTLATAVQANITQLGGPLTFNNLEAFRSAANSYWRISGGDSAGQGGSVIVFGQSHATTPSAVQINGSGGVAVTGATTFSTTVGASGLITASGGILINGGSTAQGEIFKSASAGLVIRGITGSSYDYAFQNAAGSSFFLNPTGTFDAQFLGAVSIGAAIPNGVSDLFINPSRTLAVNASAFGIQVAPAFAEAASGTHSLIASVSLAPPTITNGGATTTNAATLYVSDAPTGGASNYALFVDAGDTRLDGNVRTAAQFQVGSASALLTNVQAYITGTITAPSSAFATGLVVDTTVAPGAAAGQVNGLSVQPTLKTFTSGAVSVASSVRIVAPVLTTQGTGTFTNAASLYIETAPSAATNNYALKVATGATALGGTLDVTGAATIDSPTFVVDATNNRVGIGTASPSVTLHVNRTGMDGLGVVAPAAFDTDAKTANDGIAIPLRALDSTNAITTYGQITARIDDPTDTSEDSTLLFAAQTAGTVTTSLTMTSALATFAGAVVAPRYNANGTLTAGTYNFDVLGAAGADRTVLRAGILTVTNGFTVNYSTATGQMHYSFLSGNMSIGGPVLPSTGLNLLVFAQGTAPSGMGLNSAAIYAADVSGTAQMFAANESGTTIQLTGASMNTLATVVQDNITRLGTIASIGAALGPGFGGTGIASYAVGDLLYASGATTLSKLADVAAGSYLRSGGVTTAPVWSTLTLPNAATANRVAYATGTNAWGESANLTFDGTTLISATAIRTATWQSSNVKFLLNNSGSAAVQLTATQTTAPTCSTNCGTSPSVTGSDTFFKVTMGASGSPASGWVVTFNGTWATAPVCSVTMAKTGMVVGKLALTVVTNTTTMTVVTNGTAPANSDVYAVQCGGIS